MKVNIYRATLVIENKEVRLTKAIAKQFPVRSFEARRGVTQTIREPICKVSGETLGNPSSWLYLVKDEEAGLVWEPACIYREDFARGMRERGYHVDDPSQVPTVIL